MSHPGVRGWGEGAGGRANVFTEPRARRAPCPRRSTAIPDANVLLGNRQAPMQVGHSLAFPTVRGEGFPED